MSYPTHTALILCTIFYRPLLIISLDAKHLPYSLSLTSMGA